MAACLRSSATPILEFLATGPLAHVVTLGPGGDPHVSMAWVGVEDGEVVMGTLHDQRKLQNLRADPRVALSFQVPGWDGSGLTGYLVLRGRARVTEGGAPELLQRLAQTYIGPRGDVSRRCRTRRRASSPGSPSTGSRGWATWD